MTRLVRHRLVAAGAAVVATLAVGLAGWAVHVRSQPITRTQVTTYAPAPAADDCPAGRTCVSAAVRSQLITAVRSVFPSVAVVASAATVDANTGQHYAETLVATVGGGVSMTLTTRCVDGATSMPTRSAAPTGSAAQPTGSAARPAGTIAFYAAGRDGCGAAVAVTVPSGPNFSPSPFRTLVELPQVQLAR